MFALRAARAFTGRPLVARFERAYHGTHDAVMAGTPGVPDALSGPDHRAAVGRPRGRRARLAGGTMVAAIVVEPVQGAGGVRAAPPSFLRFLRPTSRIGALLVFDEIISFRVGPERRAGRLGRPAGPDDARQDHRWRVPARRVRRPRGRHGPVRRAPRHAPRPRRDVQRQPGRRRCGPRDAAPPDARAVRGARDSGRPAPLGARDGIERDGLDARVAGIASLFQVFPGSTLTPAASPQAALFLGLLLDGFHLAPRGLGATDRRSRPRRRRARDAVVQRLGSMQAVVALTARASRPYAPVATP